NSYGSLGRVTRQRDEAGQAWTIAEYANQSYAGSFGMSRVQTRRGAEVRYWNDASLRLTQRDFLREPYGVLLQRLSWAYDGNNNVTSATDPSRIVTSSTYDANGNVLTKTLDSGPGGLALRWSYTYNA